MEKFMQNGIFRSSKGVTADAQKHEFRLDTKT